MPRGLGEGPGESDRSTGSRELTRAPLAIAQWCTGDPGEEASSAADEMVGEARREPRSGLPGLRCRLLAEPAKVGILIASLVAGFGGFGLDANRGQRSDNH
jgi:hypothetical protein